MPVSGQIEQSLLNVAADRSGFGLDECVLANKDEPHDMWQNVTDEMIPNVEEQLLSKGIKETQCPNCGQSSETSLWFKCWDNPLISDKLESENLCHCGGDLWLDPLPAMIPGAPKKFGWVCDNCEWVKPNETVSGAQ